MPRYSLVLAVAAALLGPLAACSRQQAERNQPEDDSAAPLSFAAPPARILPANAAALDFTCALVGPERLVAVPETAAGYSSAPMGEEAWYNLPTLAQYSAEGVLAFEPELVVAHAWQDLQTTHVLRRSGVAVLELPDAYDEATLFAIVSRLGELLHAEERARELIAELEARRAALAARAPSEPPSAMYYSNFGTGGWTAGAGTAEDFVLRLAGLRNAATEAGLEKHAQIDIEQLLTIDPDLLIVSASDEDSRLSATRAYLGGEPALRELRAVREERLILLPARLYSCTSQHMLDAAERILDTLATLEAAGDGPADR